MPAPNEYPRTATLPELDLNPVAWARWIGLARIGCRAMKDRLAELARRIQGLPEHLRVCLLDCVSCSLQSLHAERRSWLR